MHDEKHRYKAETAKLTTMLENTFKELAAIKKEHQRAVSELNEAQRSRDQIIQILKKQVAHETQERERLWAENNQLYHRLQQAEESIAEVNLLDGLDSQSRRQSLQAAPNVQQLEKLVAELREQIEALKTEKDDVLLRAEYESTIEYNKLRSQLHGTQEKLIHLEEQLQQMERSECLLRAQKQELETALTGMRNRSEGDRQNNDASRPLAMVEMQLRAEVDKLRQENEFLKEVKADLEESASEYETIIGEYRASLDEARLKYDNRELQYLREKSSDRADRQLLRTEIERLKFDSIRKEDHTKRLEEKDIIVRHLEKQLLLVEEQFRELQQQTDATCGRQIDFTSGLELVKEEYLKNLQEKDGILAESKLECERLHEANAKLDSELNQARSEQVRLKDELSSRFLARQDEHRLLLINYTQLRKEKEQYETRTKQQLARLQRQVTDMIEFDANSDRLNTRMKSENDALCVTNQMLSMQLEQLNKQLTDTVGEKIELGTQMEQLTAELSSLRLRNEKLTRDMERNSNRDREEGDLRNQLAATINRVKEQEKELQRLRILNYTSQERQRQFESQLEQLKQVMVKNEAEISRLNDMCGQQLQENKILHAELVKVSEESQRYRMEEESMMEELHRIKESSERMKDQIFHQKENQKNQASLSLEIGLLKERNQMLLRERDEAVSAREYMQQTNESLQVKLARIEAALEQLKEDYEIRAKQTLQSDAISIEEFSRLKQQLIELARTVESQRLKCSSLERTVVEKQREIRQLTGKVAHNKERQELAQRELNLVNERSTQLKKELEEALTRTKQAQANACQLSEQLKARLTEQKSEVAHMEDTFQDRVCELELALAVKQAEADEYLRRVELLQQEKAEYQEDSKPVAVLQDQLAEKSATNEALTMEIRRLTEEKLELHEQIDHKTSAIYVIEQSSQQLRHQLAGLEFKAGQMSADLQAKQLSYRNMTQQILQLTRAKVQLEDKYEIQKSELESTTERCKSLLAESKELRKQLQESASKSGQFKETEELLKAAIEQKQELEARITDLTEKLNTQRKQCSGLMNKQCDLSEKLRVLTEANTRSSRQIADLEAIAAELRGALETKESESTQAERKLRSLTSTITQNGLDLERMQGSLAEEKRLRQLVEHRLQQAMAEKEKAAAVSSSDTLSNHNELMATIGLLRSQNEKLQVQMCSMCKQETLDQLTAGYEAELQKERSRCKELNRQIFGLWQSVATSEEKMELLKVQHQRHIEELRNANSLDRLKQTDRANQQWVRKEQELNGLLEAKRGELAEVRDKYRTEMERNRTLVERNGKELQELTERGLEQAAKIEQLERQLRSKEELTQRFLSDKEKQLAAVTYERQVIVHANQPAAQDSSQRLAMEKLKAQLEQKSKVEKRLAEEKKQLKEQLFYIKRELENSREDLLFERKRNCHLEELYNKYRNVRSICSETFLALTKTMPPVHDKGSLQSIDSLTFSTGKASEPKKLNEEQTGTSC